MAGIVIRAAREPDLERLAVDGADREVAIPDLTPLENFSVPSSSTVCYRPSRRSVPAAASCGPSTFTSRTVLPGLNLPRRVSFPALLLAMVARTSCLEWIGTRQEGWR
jgi:hypothetical protein